MNNLPAIWSGNEEVEFPKSVADANQLLPYAEGLTAKQKSQIIVAFDIEAYDMAIDFAWRKTIGRLKESLASLGMQFIGELMGLDDVTDTTPYEQILTDYQTIQLSEQLGLISASAGLHLRHAHEIVNHYASTAVQEELDRLTALIVIKDSIKYVLGRQDMVIATEFIQFRDKLLSENLRSRDPQVEMLVNSPIFYAKTVCFILLNSIRKDQGAKIEHALANLNIILPMIWPKLGERDKFNVGFAYRDVVADNNTTAVNGLKQALMKVAGFDFVPESLRSNTFIKSARNVIEVHYGFNNFYNEPAAVQVLAQLGTTIPKPAFLQCIQAYLLVCIGSQYGISRSAVKIAEEQLAHIPVDRWNYYFEKGINNDEEVLSNLKSISQIDNLSQLLNKLNLISFSNLPKNNQLLYNALINKKYQTVIRISNELYLQMKS